MKPQISLSPISHSLLPKMLAWRNDERIYKWCRQFEPTTEDSHYAWFDRIKSDPKIKMYAAFEDTTCVGICGLTDIDYINRRAEFSLYIGPEYFGHGLGELSLRTLINHAFNVLNLNCIWGETFDGNQALKTFKKLGFKEEGRRRSFYYRDGKYIDAILVSILKDEFK